MSFLKMLSNYFINSCQVKPDKHGKKDGPQKKVEAEKIISEIADVNSNSKERLDKLIATLDSDPTWFLTMRKRKDVGKNE